ncbi:hypothetical protein CDV31_016235 [Fusarium ambrosium]|uniref:homogentisate 1,2-dioxygenase n=1 Tax=Fusarium ambrosium TaxID=131363 RepID=A0A428SCP1_9HYPO|nr:hypothetical protein CDV31_016235 [Fusarium ambrosium]
MTNISTPIYITNFALKEKYTYLNGLGNLHQSEAFPDAVPLVNSYPQHAKYGLRSEKVSGTSFTATPRSQNLWSFLYRARPSYNHGTFELWNQHLETANPSRPKHLTPNSYVWPTFNVTKGDWTAQHLLGGNGSPTDKTGVAIWLFHVNKDMPPQTVFSSQDGEALIVPQTGALDIQTEYGKLLVRQQEIAVIPRGIKYRVTLPEGKEARGYVLELYQGHFRLPELGIIGSIGLANPRDFQVPTASFDGKIESQGDTQVAVANDGRGEWTIISRLDTKLWFATQDSTPFDVAGWQGTLYPYKYDVRRFNYIGNLNYDHADPSVFVVLTSQSYGKEPGTAVVDFAAVGEHWHPAQHTLRVPWYHRNTASEFVFPIIAEQDPKSRLNTSDTFGPWGAWLNANMVTHGSNEQEYAEWQAKDTLTPMKLQDFGVTSAIIETEATLLLTDWAFEAATKNFKDQTNAAFEGL